MMGYLTGKAEKSPRKEFFYVNDDGQVVAIRLGDVEGGVPREPGAGV